MMKAFLEHIWSKRLPIEMFGNSFSSEQDIQNCRKIVSKLITGFEIIFVNLYNIDHKYSFSPLFFFFIFFFFFWWWRRKGFV